MSSLQSCLFSRLAGTCRCEIHKATPHRYPSCPFTLYPRADAQIYVLMGLTPFLSMDNREIGSPYYPHIWRKKKSRFLTFDFVTLYTVQMVEVFLDELCFSLLFRYRGMLFLAGNGIFFFPQVYFACKFLATLLLRFLRGRGLAVKFL